MVTKPERTARFISDHLLEKADLLALLCVMFSCVLSFSLIVSQTLTQKLFEKNYIADIFIVPNLTYKAHIMHNLVEQYISS